MKNLFLFFVHLLIGTAANAQSVFLAEKQIPTQEAAQANMLIFSICEDIEEAEDDLSDFVKDRYDLKMKKNNKYSEIAEAASIPALSAHRGDLICYFHHTDTGNAASIGFAKGYDLYLNSEDDPEGMKNFRSMIKSFMTYHFQNYYQSSLSELEKQLKDANKEVHKRESDINKLKKDDINLGKKILKEDDPLKKQKMETEKLEANHQVDILYNELPPYRAEISRLESNTHEIRERLNVYLSGIQELE